MSAYTYILAPHSEANYSILEQAVAQYGDLVQESRIKAVYAKTPGDIVGELGTLLAPADSSVWLYVKATTAEIDFELIHGVEGAQIYNESNQPFTDFWI